MYSLTPKYSKVLPDASKAQNAQSRKTRTLRRSPRIPLSLLLAAAVLFSVILVEPNHSAFAQDNGTEVLLPFVATGESDASLDAAQRAPKRPPVKLVNPRVLPYKGTADPTARVFSKVPGKLFLYTSTDAPAACGKGKLEGNAGYCMPGYQVFSTSNMTNWTKHGNEIRVDSANKPKWVANKTARMWAPEVIEANGKYYMFFPAPQGTIDNMKIGVATANHPTGPFKAQEKPLAKTSGIDPSVIKVGKSWYLFTNEVSSRQIVVQKLSLSGGKWSVKGTKKKITIPGIGPGGGFVEGPFVYKRGGNLWLQYAHSADGGWENGAGYRIRQIRATNSNKPLGSWKTVSASAFCNPTSIKATAIERFHYSTNHTSVVQNFKGKNYIFYHKVNSETGYFSRQVMFSPISFRGDGSVNTIQPPGSDTGFKWPAGTDLSKDPCAPPPPAPKGKVGKTMQVELGKLTGAGVTANGKGVGFTTLNGSIVFPNFNFNGASSIIVRYATDASGRLQVFAGDKIVGDITLGNTGSYATYKTKKIKLSPKPSGTKKLVLRFKASKTDPTRKKDFYDLDWVKFVR